MDDEKLIALVEKYPMLYDKHNKDFKIASKKKYVWQKIAAIMETDGIPIDENVVAKRWLSLRDRFGRELRFTQNTSMKRWMLMDQLEFLRSHIIQRPMRQSNPSSSCLIPKCEENSSLYLGSPVAVSAISSPEDPLFEQSSSPLLVDPACPLPSASIASYSASPKRKTRASEIHAAMLEAVKMLHEVCERKPSREEVGAEIRGFLTMIGATISNLKKVNQARVMQRCTEIVMQAQVEEEEENVMHCKIVT